MPYFNDWISMTSKFRVITIFVKVNPIFFFSVHLLNFHLFSSGHGPKTQRPSSAVPAPEVFAGAAGVHLAVLALGGLRDGQT